MSRKHIDADKMLFRGISLCIAAVCFGAWQGSVPAAVFAFFALDILAPNT